MATVEAQLYYPKHTSIWENVTSLQALIIVWTNIHTVARSLQLVMPGLILSTM